MSFAHCEQYPDKTLGLRTWAARSWSHNFNSTNTLVADLQKHLEYIFDMSDGCPDPSAVGCDVVIRPRLYGASTVFVPIVKALMTFRMELKEDGTFLRFVFGRVIILRN